MQTKSRSGAVLVCVLVCVSIVIALVLSTLQSSLRGRQEVRMQRQLLQTELLCQAGVQRAVGQIKKSSEYQGETWMPKLGIASFEFVAIEIRVEDLLESPRSVRVEVVATLASSAASNDSMQRSHTFVVHSTKPSITESKP